MTDLNADCALDRHEFCVINKEKDPSLLFSLFLFFPKLCLFSHRKGKYAEKQLIIIIYMLEYERTSHKEFSSPPDCPIETTQQRHNFGKKLNFL